MKHSNTHFGAYLYSAGTQHGNLHQSSATISKVTYLILCVQTEACVSHSYHGKNSGEVLGKNEGERTGQVEIRQEEILGSRRCMQSYILIYSTR